MKKKKTANAIMVAIIAVIVAGGVLAAGHIRGWFDKTPEASVLTGFKGIVNIERDSVAYNVQEDTALRKGDKISLAPDATVKISVGEGSVVLGGNAVLTVEDPSQKNFKASISAGEAFVSTKDDPVDISFDGKEISLKQASAALSVRAGAQSVAVYSGEVDGVKAGNVKEWVGAESSVYELDINSLNDFVIAQIRAAGDDSGLVIAKADVDALVEKRQAEIEEARRQAEEEAKAEAEERPPKKLQERQKRNRRPLRKLPERLRQIRKPPKKLPERLKNPEKLRKKQLRRLSPRKKRKPLKKLQRRRKRKPERLRRSAKQQRKPQRKLLRKKQPAKRLKKRLPKRRQRKRNAERPKKRQRRTTATFLSAAILY